jgi:hypothetical protein
VIFTAQLPPRFLFWNMPAASFALPPANAKKLLAQTVVCSGHAFNEPGW